MHKLKGLVLLLIVVCIRCTFTVFYLSCICTLHAIASVRALEWLYMGNTLLWARPCIKPSSLLCRLEDDCGKDYRPRERDYDRDREYERIQRERDKLRRQDEERRRQKERFEKDRVFRRKEEDVKKEERDGLREKGKRAELADYNTEKPERVAKEDKKDEMAKRDRIRNKVRLLYFSLVFRLWVGLLRVHESIHKPIFCCKRV